MKTKNSLKVIKHEVDWLKLIKMAFEKKDWGKTYTLYINKDVRIECSMREFNFEESYATFKLNCVYKDDKFSSSVYNYELLGYYLDNYTVDDFKRLVLRRVETLLSGVIINRLKRIAENKYKSQCVLWSQINEELINQYGYSEDYAEVQQINNIDLRSVATAKLKSIIHDLANKEYNKSVKKYQNNKSDIPELQELLDDIVKENKSVSL